MMKQVVHYHRKGLRVDDVPPPTVKPRGVLVRNIHSMISVGTERTIIQFAEKSIVQKARERRDLVHQVINLALQQGVRSTYEMAMGRLDAPVTPGYSSAGVVIGVGDGVDDLNIGDRVACAGAGYATHAEVVWVPKNLCVHIPESVDFESAAFTTLGAIALQGLRVSDLRVGECVAVIGLGLVGQLAVQLARAAGGRVLGIDIDPERVALALELGTNMGAIRGQDDVNALAQKLSRGRGVDAVLITAATTSNDPVELAGEILREKGRVVVVGAVGMDIPRRPYYEKELDLRLSRSYGPGRYDPTYEEKGVDYPIGYVRWTERRNMEAFLDLLAAGKVQVGRLITHRFPIEEAEQAYQLITSNKGEPFLGVLLTYPFAVGSPQPVAILTRRVDLRAATPQSKQRPAVSPSATPSTALRAWLRTSSVEPSVNIGLIGAGNFAKGVLLPDLRKVKNLHFRGVVTGTGVSAKHAGQKYGFGYCTTDYQELLADPAIDAVIIATRHNLHATMARQALEAGKYVFVEKPLALSQPELDALTEAWQESPADLMVGFNRRFAPLVGEVMAFLAGRTTPLVMNYRVNAGFVPRDSWVHSEEGGGRILGEVCHFVDLLGFLAGAPPTRVFAEAISSGNPALVDQDSVNITIKFQDGSLGTISYVALGDKAFPKERLEVFGDGAVCVVDDFKKLVLIRKGKRRKMRRWSQDKGHHAELAAFINAIRQGAESPLPFAQAWQTTVTTFKILKSLQLGEPVDVPLVELGRRG